VQESDDFFNLQRSWSLAILLFRDGSEKSDSKQGVNSLAYDYFAID
jgi:hypothetical protein